MLYEVITRTRAGFRQRRRCDRRRAQGRFVLAGRGRESSAVAGVGVSPAARDASEIGGHAVRDAYIAVAVASSAHARGGEQVVEEGRAAVDVARGDRGAVQSGHGAVV